MALFQQLLDFMKALRAKLGSVQIYTLNLYFPSNSKYKSYESAIEKWNDLLVQHSDKVGEKYVVIDVNKVMTSASDFVYDIEPSEVGSTKIAETIVAQVR